MDVLEQRAAWRERFEAWLAAPLVDGRRDWKRYPRPRNAAAPPGPGVEPAKARLMLVSSAGGYLGAGQQPFDATAFIGDYSVRRLPSATPFGAIAFAHEHYDHAAVNEDPQVLLPLRHLEALAAEGAIGSLAPSFVSFMGYQPDVTLVVDETLPAVLAAAEAEHADAVLLVPS